MSYREENGQVVLTMSREDYEQFHDQIDIVLDWATEAPFHISEFQSRECRGC
jgi:hypothetical protein